MDSAIIAVQGVEAAHPCTCLCLGSLLQITLTTPWRRMILQSLHIFFTDALTFTNLSSLLQTFDYSAPPRVLRGDLDLHPVPGEEPQVMTAYTPRPVSQDFVPILQGDPEKGVGQRLHDRP